MVTTKQRTSKRKTGTNNAITNNTSSTTVKKTKRAPCAKSKTGQTSNAKNNPTSSRIPKKASLLLMDRDIMNDDTLTENHDPQDVPMETQNGDPPNREQDQDYLNDSTRNGDDDDEASLPTSISQVGKDASNDSESSSEGDDNDEAAKDDNNCDDQDDETEQDQGKSVNEKEDDANGIGILTAAEASVVIAQARNIQDSVEDDSMPALSPKQPGLGNHVLGGNISFVAPTTDGIISVITDSNSHLMVQGYYDANGELPSAPRNFKQKASEYVRDKLWHQMKWIGGESYLAFEGNICASALRFFGVRNYYQPGDVVGPILSPEQQDKNNEIIKAERQLFWNGLSPYINKNLNTVRANRCSEMENCFNRYQKSTGKESKMPNGALFLDVIKGPMRIDTTNTYKLIMLVFGPGCVTSKYLTTKIMAGVAWSEIITAQDEAFILLALLNYWNAWFPDNLKILNDDWNKDSAMWSTKGVGKNWSPFGGWDVAAHTLYTKLFERVRDNRSDPARNGTFDAAMRKLIVDSFSLKNKKKMNKFTAVNDSTTITAAISASALDSMLDLVD